MFYLANPDGSCGQEYVIDNVLVSPEPTVPDPFTPPVPVGLWGKGPVGPQEGLEGLPPSEHLGGPPLQGGLIEKSGDEPSCERKYLKDDLSFSRNVERRKN